MPADEETTVSNPIRNPFEYEAANDLGDDLVAEYFIDDFNYSRFIQSRRNIFVVGERGSGKTMALLYSSLRVQRVIASKEGKEPSLQFVGIYVPCITPLTYKPEFELLDPFLSSILSEHLFVLSICHAIVTTLSEIPDLLVDADEPKLRAEFSEILATALSDKLGFLDSMRVFLETQIRDTQRTAVSRDLGAYHEETFSFASLVMPFLGLCRRAIPTLGNTHFLILIDDAHALNERQVWALNSWIAFRDHSLFSFKVATTKVARTTKQTTSGGSILEGHDYTTIDLERPFHNPRTGFFKLAKSIVAQRLDNVGVTTPPEDFFPTNPDMDADLEQARDQVREIAIEKYGHANKKAVGDYIYKYSRSRYFKNRPPKANLPPYSGFDTLVFISTGVVRNLLEPCYWMFDRAMSDQNSDFKSPIKSISYTIQTEIILERSNQAWARLRERLANEIEGCTREDGKRAYRLIDGLASHFRDRLLGDGSEPSALSFTISNQGSDAAEKLMPIIDILRAAQMLYVRMGTAKDGGRREPYYIPNRILWPSRGLDPHGQHARVSLTSDSLWHAAETGSLHTSDDVQSTHAGTDQEGFWDED